MQDLHHELGLPTPGAVTDADRKRAADAILAAPKNELGLILPPHVAAARATARTLEKHPPPPPREQRVSARQQRRARKETARRLKQAGL